MVVQCSATCQPGTRYTAPEMKYTVAVIGLGTIADAHLGAIAAHRRLRLVGVCDSDEDTLNRRSAATGVRGFRDYRELLQSAPEVAVVALPHHLHRGVAVAPWRPAATCWWRNRWRYRSSNAALCWRPRAVRDASWR